MITTIKNTDSEQKARITELVASNGRLRLDNDGLRLLCARLKEENALLLGIAREATGALDGAARYMYTLNICGKAPESAIIDDLRKATVHALSALAEYEQCSNSR